MRILFGLIMVIIGFLFVWKSDWLFQTFGSVDFAERFLHTEGGSRLFYKLLGILIIVIGFMTITQMYTGIFNWLGVTLFGGFVPDPNQLQR